MARKIILWLSVFLFTLFFAGHLYEEISVIPNWSSGGIPDVSLYRDFFHVSGPANYYSIIIGSSFVFSIAALIAVWRDGKARMWATLSLLVILAYLPYTYVYFLPTNFYVAGTSYDAAVLKQLVDRWTFHEWFRLALIGVGLISSIFCLEAARSFTSQPTSQETSP